MAKQTEQGVRIDKIQLQIGRKTIELSVQEAKDLKRILGELFADSPAPQQAIREKIYRDPWRPYWGITTYPYYCGTWCASVSNTCKGDENQNVLQLSATNMNDFADSLMGMTNSG